MSRLASFVLLILYGLMCDLYIMMEFIDVVFMQLLLNINQSVSQL
jgi:hypothetical protein